jgi:hypothetical protein
MADSSGAYDGLLFIGDPHLEGRQPGFRKDDYPNVILDKLAWCLEYARSNRLLPCILGDLFDKPRDNPNWLLVRLLQLLTGEVIGLYGNHDVHYDPQLTDDDSLALLVNAGRLRLVSEEAPWVGTMGSRTVVVGGASYRQTIPRRFSLADGATAGDKASPFVVWLTHHDLLIPGYEEARLKPWEIDGVDLVINGHIHRRLEDVVTGKTLWLTPGNISRRSRSDAAKAHVPSALRLDVTPSGYELAYIEIPHRPFDEVFHPAIVAAAVADAGSAFVAGLAELQARRTASGAGLLQFLEQNLAQFEPDVSQEIMRLAQEVTHEDSH